MLASYPYRDSHPIRFHKIFPRIISTKLAQQSSRRIPCALVGLARIRAPLPLPSVNRVPCVYRYYLYSCRVPSRPQLPPSSPGSPAEWLFSEPPCQEKQFLPPIISIKRFASPRVHNGLGSSAGAAFPSYSLKSALLENTDFRYEKAFGERSCRASYGEKKCTSSGHGLS